MRRPSAASAATALAVAGAALFVFVQLQPRLLLTATTPNGGDMGAHVWGPAFIRDHLLPHGRITGWAPDWYAGFAFPTFYFPLPSLLVILLDVLLPYQVAFKLVTVAGMVSLPVAAWAFGKLARLRAPGPACLAVATLPFLFDRTFTIYGGNIASTLAGEYSYSISLSLALLFLGVTARMLDTGRHRALAGALLALTLLSHVVPTFFAVTGAVVLLLLQPSVRRLQRTLLVGVLGGMLTAFWALPFVANLAFTNDMAYEKMVEYRKNLLPHNLRWLVALAGVGALISLARRCRVGTFLTIMAGLSALAFRFAPQGKIWNPRLLPFWFLCLSMLAGIAAASIAWFLVAITRPRRPASPPTAASPPGLAPAPLLGLPSGGNGAEGYEPDAVPERVHALLAKAESTTFPEEAEALTAKAHELLARVEANQVAAASTRAVVDGADVPTTSLALEPIRTGELWAPTDDAPVAGTAARRALFDVVRPAVREHATTAVTLLVLAAGLIFVAIPLHLPLLDNSRAVPGLGKIRLGWAKTNDRSYVPDWARWNYNGYERKTSYPEYKALIDTMTSVGRTVGCGRAHWEYEPELDQLGTPLALMLLPYWTHGCIGSMEGLYFESSATTPYHFLSASELSRKASRPQRGLSYRDFDVPFGVRHLQMLGSRYYMAFSAEAKAAAAQDPELHLVASTPSFPVNYSTGPGQRSWSIYEVLGSGLVEPLANAPVVVKGVAKEKDWLEMSAAWFLEPSRWSTYLAAGGPADWKRVARSAAVAAPFTPVARQTEVSGVRVGDDRISFDVDQPGTPILVKISYFPNWQATGANGPWRISPNLMVVVPTDRHVELHYGRTTVDVAGTVLTVLGLISLLAVSRLPLPPDSSRRSRGRAGESAPVVAEGEPQADEPPHGTGDPADDRRPGWAGLPD